MTLQEIKIAVVEGKRVCWKNRAYFVVHDWLDKNGRPYKNGCDQWLIKCELNDHCIGLTWRDGVTMNGKPEDFFIPED